MATDGPFLPPVGWIEHERNLSQKCDNAWVGEDAQVKDIIYDAGPESVSGPATLSSREPR